MYRLILSVLVCISSIYLVMVAHQDWLIIIVSILFLTADYFYEKERQLGKQLIEQLENALNDYQRLLFRVTRDHDE